MTFEQMVARKKEKGYSCRQLSELSGVPFSTVTKIFSGITKNPRHETLDALEAALYDSVTPYQAKKAGYDTDSFAEPLYLHDIEAAYSGVEASSRKSFSDGRGYTVDDYLALPKDRRCELIDGVLYDLAPPSISHQLVLGELYIQFRNCISDHASECTVLFAPCAVRLDMDNRTMVEPDLIVFCDSKNYIFMADRYFDGAPDLVAEILSESTRRRDMTVKLAKYRNAGVREYWIVDIRARQIMVYDLTSYEFPRIFRFDEKVPVQISKGTCKIDISKVIPQLKE